MLDMTPAEYLAQQLLRRAARAGSGFDDLLREAAKVLVAQEREIQQLKGIAK